jgi:hypothetical protein
MKTITAIAAKHLGKFLAKDIRQLFGSAQQDRAERLGSLAQSTIECLGRSDALYHNLEHTMLVTIVGRDILRGRIMTERIAIRQIGVSEVNKPPAPEVFVQAFAAGVRRLVAG